MSMELQRALEAFDAGRLDQVRAALVLAWRKRRSSRLAELVELLDEAIRKSKGCPAVKPEPLEEWASRSIRELH